VNQVWMLSEGFVSISRIAAGFRKSNWLNYFWGFVLSGEVFPIALGWF
jgi:hypothetical protein